jgi:hypothetical protein
MQITQDAAIEIREPDWQQLIRARDAPVMPLAAVVQVDAESR